MAIVAGVTSVPDRLGSEFRSVERIRAAALMSLATHGTAGTSLRAVAAAAGVSLGLVQHHFATKAGLVQAVDDYVLYRINSVLAQPVSGPARSIEEVGRRVTTMIAEDPDVASYLGRALVDGSPLGTRIFDSLVAIGTLRWHQRRERGETPADLDVTWAALNSLVLGVGGLILRGHIERHLGQSLTEPVQLRRWEDAVNTLLRDGLSRRRD